VFEINTPACGDRGTPGDEVRMLGRSGEDITARYPEIAGGAARPPRAIVLDAIGPRRDGRPSFQRLQKRMRLNRPRDVAAVMPSAGARGFFDCLAAEGHDLRKSGCSTAGGPDLNVPPRNRPARITCRAGEAFRGRDEMGSKGAAESAPNSRYTGRRSATGQVQVPAPAGVRGRRLHGPQGRGRNSCAQWVTKAIGSERDARPGRFDEACRQV